MASSTDVLIIILAVILAISLLVNILLIFKLRAAANFEKIGDGFSPEDFIKDAKTESPEGDSIDSLLKQVVYSISEGSGQFDCTARIKYEQTTSIFKKNEDISKVTARCYNWDYPQEFIPDSSIIFDEFPNSVFIFEFDEDNKFHSQNKDINHVKKTLTYHNMLLSPGNGTPFVICRITYPSNIDKDFLAKETDNFMQWFKEHLDCFITAGATYILLRITRSGAGSCVIIPKKKLKEKVLQDKEIGTIKNSNLNDIYNYYENNNEPDTGIIVISSENEILSEKPGLIIGNGRKCPKFSGSSLMKGVSRTSCKKLTEDEIIKYMHKLRQQIIDCMTHCVKKNFYSISTRVTIGEKPIYMYNNGVLIYDYDHISIKTENVFRSKEYNYMLACDVMIRSNFALIDNAVKSNDRGKKEPINRRQLFKEFTKEIEDKINDTKLNIIAKMMYACSYIMLCIQLYENWLSSEDEGAYRIYHENICHMSDDLYDYFNVEQFIQQYKFLISPELINRFYNPSRIMCSDDAETKGYNVTLTQLDQEWIILK